ncbi:MAG: hypothetical protein BWY72_02539 [Bacteroidetes bacterium ADurb.Bin416]|nr:MAG: hypothetical protein BWY72_02539 [Bacteroidetes bacterium ADurb.Bin416]
MTGFFSSADIFGARVVVVTVGILFALAGLGTVVTCHLSIILGSRTVVVPNRTVVFFSSAVVRLCVVLFDFFYDVITRFICIANLGIFRGL